MIPNVISSRFHYEIFVCVVFYPNFMPISFWLSTDSGSNFFGFLFVSVAEVLILWCPRANTHSHVKIGEKL